MFHGQLMAKIILLILMSLVLGRFDNKANKGRKNIKNKTILSDKKTVSAILHFKITTGFSVH